MRADARRNYERLLEQARHVFSERGPDSSLDEIAHRAGVGSATLYRHFPDRDSLIRAVVNAECKALVDLGERLLDHSAPLASLTQWMRAAIAYAAAYRGLAAASMKSELDAAPQSVDSWHEPTFAVGAALLRQAQHAGVVRSDIQTVDALRMVIAIAWATAQPAVSGSGLEHTELPDRLLHLLLDGLRPDI
ncbi:TetR/AcrR family transcriptional regulator [Nocardia neocaledoniensis]|uniref:TetR/AcrR family transcriptional regulator n=1 Tax=Nocardia neocaledoniensis TaxID=236511 RepID=UPI002455E713|nr:helix-turn-helix domain-containing protein [Nocardia neocaledoniensis]